MNGSFELILGVRFPYVGNFAYDRIFMGTERFPSLNPRVVSKNQCNSRFLPSRGVTVVVVDDPTQHRATMHWTDGFVGNL